MEDDENDHEIFELLDSLVEDGLADTVWIEDEQYFTISPTGIEALKEAGYLTDVWEKNTLN